MGLCAWVPRQVSVVPVPLLISIKRWLSVCLHVCVGEREEQVEERRDGENDHELTHCCRDVGTSVFEMGSTSKRRRIGGQFRQIL